MRKNIKVWTISALVSLSVCAYANAQTEPDVYVDLSALDELSGTGSPVIHTEPLFPVVTARQAAEEKAKPAKKAVRKKAKPAAAKPVVKKEKAKPEVKVEVVEKAPAEQPKSEPAASVVQPAAPVTEPEVKAQPVAEVEPVVPAAPAAKTEPAVVLTEAEPAKPSAEPQSENKAKPVDDEVVVVDVEPLANPVKVVDVEPVSPAKAQPTAEEKTTEPAAKPEASSADNQPQTAAEVKKPAPGRFAFDAEVSDLNDAQKAQLDNLVNGFENPAVNKIAILAFNLDDGVDTFKKKRLSLNRAIEIRSYLLQKGYKNFSIKVINVDAASDKVNTVEVEELK